MKKYYWTCWTFLSLFFLSCVQEQTYQGEQRFSWDDFETIPLHGKVLEFDEDIMNPYHLLVRDSFLLTMNQGTEKLCHIFNLHTMKKVNEQVIMGQGANDMIHPFFVDSKDSFALYDPMTSNVFNYSLDVFVYSENVVPASRIKLNEKALFSELATLENQYVSVSYRPDTPCYIFDAEGNKQDVSFGKYPMGPEEYSDLEVVNAFRAIPTSNKKDRVSVCHIFTDLIDFYNDKGELLKRMHGPDHFYTSFIEFNNGTTMGSKPNGDYYRDAFYSPVGTDDYLFVLYNGKFVNKPGHDLLAKNLLVFDWNGCPKYCYQLDKGVSIITVNPIERKIYGVSDDPEYHIVEFTY